MHFAERNQRDTLVVFKVSLLSNPFAPFVWSLLTCVFSCSSTMLPANLLLLMVLLLPQASSGRQGGDTSKTDHGRGSPVPSSLLSPPLGFPLKPSLAQTIQSLLLNRLGLQSQPDPGPGVPVPQYILDLYRFHQQQYHLVEDPLFSFPTQHIQQANTVRSFHHNGKVAHKHTHKQQTFLVGLHKVSANHNLSESNQFFLRLFKI